ncbi:hypothetical protein PV11_02212 [Exophiala sideris]|uniref:Trichothecene 3-O-acetyltransferase-like N-terminal domain-containing protein n=1 Tax=Exophiala sideris TaxID=1016849 RepID=A0A0D1YVP1_9EURO|nr:hypothetical protein PV11_02212 [Exophiala sideris]
MDPEATHDSSTPLDIELDVLAQQSRLNRLYTQVTFCFKLPSDPPLLELEIINTLNRGVELLIANFPWLSGTVVNDDGTFKIRDSQKPLSLVVKDLRDDPDFPTWDLISRANFPFRMLDEDDIAPCRTLTDPDSTALGLPVFLIQANLIKGGLLLTINGQHGSMDMAGQSQIMYLFAKACRNEPFTLSEMTTGNLDRKTVTDLLEDDMGNESTDDVPESASKGQSKHVEQPEHLVWAYFTFSAESLAALKGLAMKAVPENSFVSTDDVLSAVTWQAMCRVRLARLGSEESLASTLTRNVDMRRYLSLPPTYPGFVTQSTSHTTPIDLLSQEALGTVALRLRAALDGTALTRKTRLQASRIRRGENTAVATSSVPELDVRLSSWAKEDCCGLDFGFGKANAVRRPRFAQGAREGLVYFLPKALDGEIAVGICLRTDDMERLRTEEEFVRFGTCIG